MCLSSAFAEEMRNKGLTTSAGDVSGAEVCWVTPAVGTPSGLAKTSLCAQWGNCSSSVYGSTLLVSCNHITFTCFLSSMDCVTYINSDSVEKTKHEINRCYPTRARSACSWAGDLGKTWQVCFLQKTDVWMPLAEVTQSAQAWLASRLSWGQPLACQTWWWASSQGFHPRDAQAAPEGKPKTPTFAHGKQGLVPGPSPRTWVTHICWDIFLSQIASTSYTMEYSCHAAGKGTSWQYLLVLGIFHLRFTNCFPQEDFLSIVFVLLFGEHLWKAQLVEGGDLGMMEDCLRPSILCGLTVSQGRSYWVRWRWEANDP